MNTLIKANELLKDKLEKLNNEWSSNHLQVTRLAPGTVEVPNLPIYSVTKAPADDGVFNLNEASDPVEFKKAKTNCYVVRTAYTKEQIEDFVSSKGKRNFENLILVNLKKAYKELLKAANVTSETLTAGPSAPTTKLPGRETMHIRDKIGGSYEIRIYADMVSLEDSI